MIEIIEPGLEATVQDRGRSGYAHLGVPRAGAADRTSFNLANRLVGNPADAAGVEFLLGPYAVRFERAARFVVTGAPVSPCLDGRPVAQGVALWAHAGQVLWCGYPAYGLRSYLAVAGGVDVCPVFGSRSSDTLSGLGPAPLVAGERLPLGAVVGSDAAAVDVVPLLNHAPELEVRAAWGPREDWFTANGRQVLVSATWTVSAATDRIAARLEGPVIESADRGQLPSEGLHYGSVQVPPSGLPIIHLANHPPTGGYPVIAVIREADTSTLAQAVPGTRVRIRASVPASV